MLSYLFSRSEQEQVSNLLLTFLLLNVTDGVANPVQQISQTFNFVANSTWLKNRPVSAFAVPVKPENECHLLIMRLR